MHGAAAVLLTLAAGAAMSAEAPCATDAAVRRQLALLAQQQSEPVAQAVERIEGTGRQLLALRSYARTQRSIADRWSWTQAQIDAYLDSDEYRYLQLEIDRISARFAADNPGFTLYANMQVRSLDVQISRWNENSSVGAIAADLYRAACVATPQRLDAFRQFLLDWQPDAWPPLAAPGLSQHGRARAIDFQVQQGDRLVAGTSTAEIESAWMVAGWSQKLAAAIEATSTKFHGPLLTPNEPWHYEYRP